MCVVYDFPRVASQNSLCYDRGSLAFALQGVRGVKSLHRTFVVRLHDLGAYIT